MLLRPTKEVFSSSPDILIYVRLLLIGVAVSRSSKACGCFAEKEEFSSAVSFISFWPKGRLGLDTLKSMYVLKLFSFSSPPSEEESTLKKRDVRTYK